MSEKLLGKIAFSSRRDGVDHIYVMDADGSGVRQLTNGPYADTYPAWSPDGSKLLFWRAYNGAGIYLMNADGTRLRRVSPSSSLDVTPSWSPTGTEVVFSRLIEFPTQPRPPRSQLMIMDLAGRSRLLLPSVGGTINLGPRWSVNGKIAFQRSVHGAYQHIFTINADGSGLTQLTHDGDGANGDPAWSPDGSWLVFGSNREGRGKLNLFIMRSDGSDVRQVTHADRPLEAGDASWSPDGKMITYELDWPASGQSDPNAHAEVWIINADGTGGMSTGQECSAVGCAPRWSPQ